jgi:hypothetical protein
VMKEENRVKLTFDGVGNAREVPGEAKLEGGLNVIQLES